MITQGQEKKIICPLCGKKIVGKWQENGILKYTCSNCKIIATSKYRDKKRLEILISFTQ